MGGAKTFEEKVRKGGQVQTGYFFLAMKFLLNILSILGDHLYIITFERVT